MNDTPPKDALADLAYHRGWKALREWMSARQRQFERDALAALTRRDFAEAEVCAHRARAYQEIIAHVDGAVK